MIHSDKYITHLIVQSQLGNKNTYLELVNILQSTVYKLAVQLSDDKTTAEEIAVDVFIKAWEKIKYLTDYTPFDVWIKGLTVNNALTAFRINKESVKGKIVNEVDKDIISSSKEDELFLSFDSITRKILILHDLEGYSIKDSAELLDENDTVVLKEKLDYGRKLFAGEETISLLNNYDDDEWTKVISDFEMWKEELENSNNLTKTLELIKEYRSKLSALLSDNEIDSIVFEKLKNKFQVEGEKIIEKRKIEKIKSKKQTQNFDSANKEKRIRSISDTFSFGEFQNKTQQYFIKQLAAFKNYIFLFISIITVSFLFYWGYGLLFIETTFPWKVLSTNGTVQINGFETINEINADDVIEVKNLGGLSFEISDVGVISIYGHSSISIIEGEKENNVIKLKFGKLITNTTQGNSSLKILADDITIDDLGSQAIFEFSPEKTGIVNVQSGNILIFKGNWLLPLTSNYLYDFKNIAPYNKNSSAVFKEILAEIPTPVTLTNNLTSLLTISSKRDALSLFSLMQQSEREVTYMIFEKLNSFFPPPEGVSVDGILHHNPEMLLKWLKSILIQF